MLNLRKVSRSARSPPSVHHWIVVHQIYLQIGGVTQLHKVWEPLLYGIVLGKLIECNIPIHERNE